MFDASGVQQTAKPAVERPLEYGPGARSIGALLIVPIVSAVVPAKLAAHVRVGFAAKVLAVIDDGVVQEHARCRVELKRATVSSSP